MARFRTLTAIYLASGAGKGACPHLRVVVSLANAACTPGVQHWRLVDVREALDWVLKEAEIEKHVSLHNLRHSYCASRLQTYHCGPNGQAIQVGVFQVACELGHRGGALVEQVYAQVSPRPDRLQPEVRYARKQENGGRGRCPGSGVRGVILEGIWHN